MTDRIYLSPPHVGIRERQLLLDAFESNWVAPVGPQLDAFESEMCARVGVRAACAVSSGTAALHLALTLLGVQAGDYVLTSTLSFVASANAIAYTGAQPIFIDCDPKTWQADPELLDEALRREVRSGRRPKAVLIVDIYGQSADYDRIRSSCEAYEVPLIEDAAEALGAEYKGRWAGTLGELGAYSFNGNKIITTGGGGMLVSNRPEWVEDARFLATQARDPAPHYQHSRRGFNYRMSNLLAAVGRAQLESLSERVQQRRWNNTFYRSALGVEGISFMPEADYGRSNCWLTCLTLDPTGFGVSRDRVIEHLENHDIESRPVWKPLHLQPLYSECRVYGGTVSQGLFERGLCLPSGSNLTKAQLSRVAELILALSNN